MPSLHSKPSLPKNTIRPWKLRDSLSEIEEVSKLPRFDPIYEDDTEANRKAKESAWNHIPPNGRDPDETDRKFLASILDEISKLARFSPIYRDDNRKAKESAWNHILQKSRDRDEAERKYFASIQDNASKFVRFGPIYGADTEINRKAKESAWNHILQRSRHRDEGEGKNLASIQDDVSKLVRDRYLTSIGGIENQAVESYDSSTAAGNKAIKQGFEFRLRMVKDGCFFLQLALHILGGTLHYPAQHPYFGEKSDSTSRIPEMFFLGNQIPYVVIRALMKQDFFQKVIQDKGTWQRQRPTDDNLAKLVLYLAVVEPELKKPSPNRFSKMMKKFRGKPGADSERPSNILQILRRLMLGPGDNDAIYSEMKEFYDLEAGNDDGSIEFPSAGELYKSGIKLRKSKGGISNIRFRNHGYSAYLYLPPFIIDSHTEHLLSSLAGYEQSLSESDREVTAYLRFMRDLVRTYKDFKILENKGIIKVKKDKLKGSMVHMLDKLVTIHNSHFTLNFRQTRQKIKDYGGPPWRLISFILGVLTLVQTIFTILSYFIPLH